MKLMVTGGSGFLGGYVLREAARRGHRAVALARSEAAAGAATALGALPVSGDLNDAHSLIDAFAAQRCDVLVNLASLGFGHGPVIIAAAERAGIPRAVFVSTTAVTTTLVATSKRVRLLAEQAIREAALDWAVLRPTMIYGDPGDRNLSRLLPLLRRAHRAAGGRRNDGRPAACGDRPLAPRSRGGRAAAGERGGGYHGSGRLRGQRPRVGPAAAWRRAGDGRGRLSEHNPGASADLPDRFRAASAGQHLLAPDSQRQ